MVSHEREKTVLQKHKHKTNTLVNTPVKILLRENPSRKIPHVSFPLPFPTVFFSVCGKTKRLTISALAVATCVGASSPSTCTPWIPWHIPERRISNAFSPTTSLSAFFVHWFRVKRTRILATRRIPGVSTSSISNCHSSPRPPVQFLAFVLHHPQDAYAEPETRGNAARQRTRPPYEQAITWGFWSISAFVFPVSSLLSYWRGYPWEYSGYPSPSAWVFAKWSLQLGQQMRQPPRKPAC